MTQRSGRVIGWSWESIGVNMPKASNFYEVTHYTWSTLNGSLDVLRREGMLATLIANVELQRSELSTCLCLKVCVDKKIAT
jgi:hypothetical protein